MKQKGLLLFTILMLSFTFIHAQDPEYSQIFANRLYMNPAFAGASNGLRAALIYRKLWPHVPGPFNTAGLGMDVRVPSLSGALGFTAMHDERGEGFLKTNSFGAIYSYRGLLNRNTEFSLASGVNVTNKFIDWDKLEFSDQFDPLYGKIYNSSAQRPANQSIFLADFDFGFTMNHRLRTATKDIYIGYGGAVHHLNQPDESFLGIHMVIPRKYSFYVATMIPVQNFRMESPTFVFPSIRYERQGRFQSYDVACFFYKDPGFFGISYRNSPQLVGFKNTDALILTLGVVGGLEDKGYQLAYSYDFNYMGLSGITYGSHELSLVVLLENIHRGGKKKPLNCFDFPHRGVFRMF